MDSERFALNLKLASGSGTLVRRMSFTANVISLRAMVCLLSFASTISIMRRMSSGDESRLPITMFWTSWNPLGWASSSTVFRASATVTISPCATISVQLQRCRFTLQWRQRASDRIACTRFPDFVTSCCFYNIGIQVIPGKQEFS